MNKNFAIFKREKKNEKEPDYNISMKIGEKYVTVGGCWLKEGKSGKFFSCKLSNAYGDKEGYSITTDIETNAKVDAEKAGEATKKEVTEDEIPF